jgi:hypothetical protein
MRITANSWIPEKVDVFWNEVASQDHIFHIYDNEDKFLDLLAGFVGTGVNANDCTIVIATHSHLEKLQQRLKLHGLHIADLIDDGKYAPVSAEKALSEFMVSGLPDEQLFIKCIANIIKTAKHRNRKIRIFREMGPLLSIQGNFEGSRHLEILWSKNIVEGSRSFFCAYPKTQFIAGDCKSIKKMGFLQSKLVTNAGSFFEILYRHCAEEIKA